MKMEWISVKDKQPEEGTYLCYLDIGTETGIIGTPPFSDNYDIFKYHTTQKAPGHKVPSWDARGWLGDISQYITHWMPLPDRP